MNIKINKQYLRNQIWKKDINQNKNMMNKMKKKKKNQKKKKDNNKNKKRKYMRNQLVIASYIYLKANSNLIKKLKFKKKVYSQIQILILLMHSNSLIEKIRDI